MNFKDYTISWNEKTSSGSIPKSFHCQMNEVTNALNIAIPSAYALVFAFVAICSYLNKGGY